MANFSEGIPLNYRWIVEYILLPIVFLGFTAWMTSLNAQIAEVKQSMITVNERATTNSTNLLNIVPRLDRIENKLDSVIDRQAR